MMPFVLGALAFGMIAVVCLVVGAYHAGRTTGASTAQEVFANLVESSRRDLERARDEAKFARDANEQLAADLKAERLDRQRADDERRLFASESFNAKLERSRLERQLAERSNDLAEMWAQLEVLRDQLMQVELATQTSLDNMRTDEAPVKTQPSPRLQVQT
jgi:chromosome segregation ATPase